MVLSRLTIAASVAVLWLAAPCAGAQDETSPETSIPIARFIALMAQKTGKTFIVDPRVRARVTLVGQDIASIDYDQFLAVLELHDFATVESGKVIHVVPAQNVRWLPVPIVDTSQAYPDAQHVTRIIPVKNVPAVTLIPLLRPLLPQGAHFVAFGCTNDLLVSDRFANVWRIETLVQSLDQGTPYKPDKCVTSPDIPRQSQTRPPAAERPAAGKTDEK